MARSVSQSKRLGAVVYDAIFLGLHRRGYASTAVSDVSVRSRGRSGMVGRLEDTSVSVSKQGSEASSGSAWGPDPVTGYYRPINHTPEIDPAELRDMLLNHKVRSSH